LESLETGSVRLERSNVSQALKAMTLLGAYAAYALLLIVILAALGIIR
jgi:hypothetical protein